MNAIVQFRKCTLSDEELAKKVEEITDNIYIGEYGAGGKLPPMHIPARPDEDYDLLIGELIWRFREKIDDKNNQGTMQNKGDKERDRYFEEAGRLVIKYDQMSTSLLQKRLMLGYNRAFRILKQLSENGVGEMPKAGKPGRVLMFPKQFDSIL